MGEDIKFKELRGRINTMLAQLSGLLQPNQSRINLLESIFKEIEHDLTIDEKEETLRLFAKTNKKENMFSEKCAWSNHLNYFPKLAVLNEVELHLRKLLGKYGYYHITKENKDYQLGEF